MQWWISNNMCLGSFQAYAHTVFLFSPFKTGSSFSVNVLWLFQQASIYLPSYFCSSCSSHGLCSVWRMALPQSLFFGFVPSCTCGPVPEGSFPQNKILGANMDTTHTHIIFQLVVKKCAAKIQNIWCLLRCPF